jgi:tRNA-specific 2-thiouridylase
MVLMGEDVLVAMSGGVDSSFTAAQLLRQGYRVQGIYMKLWGGQRRGSSCSTADHLAAQAAADHLGIRLHTVDWTTQFEQQVVSPFVQAAARAETGNPCISCNRQFKIQGLIAMADQLGIPWVASGHYARVVRDGDRPGLYRAIDTHKDQSYVMWAMGPEVLQRLILPNGDMHKAIIRQAARTLELPAADVPDSMELCFDPKQVVAAALGRRPGKVVDVQGQVMGVIPDISTVTVGQRRGLPSAVSGSAERRYVLRVEPQAQQVVIGSSRDMMVGQIQLDEWVATQHHRTNGLQLQTSAHGHPENGQLVVAGLQATFVLDRPCRRPSPGQFGVVYEGDRVVGAGVVRDHDDAAI